MKKRFIATMTLLLTVLPSLLAAETHEVVSSALRFVPDDITINTGDTVHWSSSEPVFHDIRSDNGAFEPSVPDTALDHSVTFNTAGEYRYYCSRHSSAGQNSNLFENGRIVVVGNSISPPNAGFDSSCNALQCGFTDQSNDSDGTITSWSWDFGDGSMSAAQSPNHVYAEGGRYSVSLTVTDNDGQEHDITKQITVTDPSFKINAAISDAWYFPETGGQGFFIIVWEDQQSIFLSWFTFDLMRPAQDVTAILGDAGHRWIIGLGPYSGAEALLELFVSQGMIFDSSLPPVDESQLDGASIEIIWLNCRQAVLIYNIPTLGISGEIPIERIVPDHVAACVAAQ